MQRKFLVNLVEEGNTKYVYEFVSEDDYDDFKLLTRVFEDYIEKPIIRCFEIGTPFIRVGSPPILNNMVTVSIDRKPVSNKIVFSLSSTLFVNKVKKKSEIDLRDETYFYLKINEEDYLVLRNQPASGVGTILFLIFITDILNGMKIEVEESDYYINCGNCVYEKEVMKKYKYLLDDVLREFVELGEGCLLKSNKYGRGDECGRFCLDVYPDIGEVREKLSRVRRS